MPHRSSLVRRLRRPPWRPPAADAVRRRPERWREPASHLLGGLMSAIRFERAAFAYAGGAPVLSDVTIHLAAGWTGAVKSTLLALATGALAPTAGVVVRDPSDAVCALCDQRVDEPTEAVHALAGTFDRTALGWIDQLRLDEADLARWPTLSPGERKR